MTAAPFDLADLISPRREIELIRFLNELGHARQRQVVGKFDVGFHFQVSQKFVQRERRGLKIPSFGLLPIHFGSLAILC